MNKTIFFSYNFCWLFNFFICFLLFFFEKEKQYFQPQFLLFPFFFFQKLKFTDFSLISRFSLIAGLSSKLCCVPCAYLNWRSSRLKDQRWNSRDRKLNVLDGQSLCNAGSLKKKCDAKLEIWKYLAGSVRDFSSRSPGAPFHVLPPILSPFGFLILNVNRARSVLRPLRMKIQGQVKCLGII